MQEVSVDGIEYTTTISGVGTCIGSYEDVCEVPAVFFRFIFARYSFHIFYESHYRIRRGRAVQVAVENVGEKFVTISLSSFHFLARVFGLSSSLNHLYVII